MAVEFGHDTTYSAIIICLIWVYILRARTARVTTDRLPELGECMTMHSGITYYPTYMYIVGFFCMIITTVCKVATYY